MVQIWERCNPLQQPPRKITHPHPHQNSTKIKNSDPSSLPPSSKDFSMNIAKFLRTPNFKKICQRLLLWFLISGNQLTHFWPIFPFYSPWKHQKFCFSGGIKWKHKPEMNYCKQWLNIKYFVITSPRDNQKFVFLKNFTQFPE